MPTSVYFNNQNATREQMLLEDLVIESIRNHGIDIYYLPRTSQSIPDGQASDYTKHVIGVDDLFGDDPVKYYDSAYKVDMYLETFQDFGGQQEFFSKFGLQIEKTARLAVARRTFEKYVPRTLRNMPKEGDLLYLPAQRKLMEIRFVERDASFFQLGKVVPYMYVLSLETFKFNGEFLNTGIEEIDFVADDTSLSTNFSMNTSTLSTESFVRGDIAYQGANTTVANARGIVVSFDRPNGILRLRNIKGEFSTNANVTVVGSVSGATGTILDFDLLKTATEGEISDNKLIQNEAGTAPDIVTGLGGVAGILDFSERNPFGEP